jgi:hypothetical protein
MPVGTKDVYHRYGFATFGNFVIARVSGRRQEPDVIDVGYRQVIAL